MLSVMAYQIAESSTICSPVSSGYARENEPQPRITVTLWWESTGDWQFPLLGH